MKNISFYAKAALVLATIIWGTSFVIIKDTVDLISPNYLMALRFTGAFILLCVIFFKKLGKINFETLWQGALIGVFLYLAYYWQTFGIMFTTPGKNAFLTAVYCVLVPFLAWISKGPRPDRWNLIAAIMCITGIGLISLNGDFAIGKGDFYTLIGGFFFACHMVAVAKFANGKDPIIITILQFASAAVCFWATTLISEGVPEAVTADAIPAVIYLCLFCTATALLLQNFGQKHTLPSSAALILSLESVFGTFFSAILGRENLTIRMICGFALIFFAIIVSETKFSFLSKKRSESDVSCKSDR